MLDHDKFHTLKQYNDRQTPNRDSITKTLFVQRFKAHSAAYITNNISLTILPSHNCGQFLGIEDDLLAVCFFL
jgi:hypothetical protein